MHSLAHAYVCSADTRRCTRIPLKIHSVDTGHPLAVISLLDSGATGMFIDAEFVRAECYEIDKHTDIYSFTPHKLRIAHKSHSQTETSKTSNNSNLSTRNINDSINSSYHDDIRPIPTLNDTNKSLGDCIYAAPIAYTPSKPHICYRELYFLFYHFIFTLLSLTL